MSNAKQVPTGFATIEVWATAQGEAEHTLARAIQYILGRKDKPDLEWYGRPGKDASAAHRRFYDQLNQAIAKGMSKQRVDPKKKYNGRKDNKADWYRLFMSPKESLPEGNQPGDRGATKGTAGYGTKRNIHAQVGLYRGRIKSAHEAALGGNKKGPDQKRTDDRTFCLERVTAMKKRLQKAAESNFDVVEATRHLAAFERVINTPLNDK